MEWIKLYGVLLGKQEEAESYFERQIERLDPILEQENLAGLRDIPAVGLGAGERDGVHGVQLPEAVHGGGGL